MTALRRSIVALLAVALVVGTAYAAGLVDAGRLPWASSTATAETAEDRAAAPEPPQQQKQRPVEQKPAPAPENPPQNIAELEPKVLMQPGPRLLGSGDNGDEVRELQARLKQIAWFYGDVTGTYGDATAEAVRGFQAKRRIPVTGEVDQRTLDRLHGMTREPTEWELTNQPPPSEEPGNDAGTLDPRCLTGRVLCIDKSTRSLRWVIDGQVHKTVDVRFGRESMPTREGTFSVFSKSRDHVSSIYHTPMPYAMFFSGGQAVHYSPDFAANGYNGSSHGCVNVRDKGGIAWLFDQVRIGDRVVVYWS